MAEDHDSSSGTKDNRTPEQKVLQASNEEEGHTGHVSPAVLVRLWSFTGFGNGPQMPGSGLSSLHLAICLIPDAWLQAFQDADTGACQLCPKCHGCSAHKSC